ncbi:unnamed protein product [Rhodiola kirilowii]
MNSSRPRDAPLRKYQRRKTSVNLDLSIGLPGQTLDQVGNSSSVARVGFLVVQPIQQQNAPVPIDVDAFDDEVLISSPRAFAEARNNSRRVRAPTVVVDVDSGMSLSMRSLDSYARPCIRPTFLVSCSINMHFTMNILLVYWNSLSSLYTLFLAVRFSKPFAFTTDSCLLILNVYGTNSFYLLRTEEQTTRFANCYKRRRNSSNCRPVNVDHVYINLETSCNSKNDKCTGQSKNVAPPPPPPPPPPPEPAFSCPICMGQLVEEMTTKCGHIFCKKCIQTAISVKSMCPTCRKKVNKKDVIRIYLPTTR